LQPLVSVCIPTYNSGRWIAETVASALGQTYENLEVIVADNGSSDDTEAVVRAFDDPRLTFELNLAERGMVRNHNWLVRRSRAELIKLRELGRRAVVSPDAAIGARAHRPLQPAALDADGRGDVAPAQLLLRRRLRRRGAVDVPASRRLRYLVPRGEPG
jgi:glycosyltransferase involved in cell wall biosynthesis